MLFWIILTICFLIAVAGILLPLFRYRNENTAPKSHAQNITVYKAQLRELAADQQAGLLNETEAASARLEIERRLLKAAEQEQQGADHQRATGTSRIFLAVITIIILLGAAGFYLTIGTPGMPDFLLKDQKHSVAKQAEKDALSVNKTREVIKIQAHLIQNPSDATAWHALGQYQSDLNRRAEAAKAYQRWYELEPDNINAAVTYGESLIMFSEGRVGPAALLMLKRARKIQPRNPAVRHYLALAQYQAGNVELALAHWKKLAADSKPGAPWLRQLNSWIGQAERDLGLRPAMNNPAMNKMAAPRLSREEQQAIAEMSSAEQAQMIKGMVGRLQEKMEQDPTNIEGWFRLAKAYTVLGQKEDAIKSLKTALEHAPDDRKSQIKKQLEVLTKQE